MPTASSSTGPLDHGDGLGQPRFTGAGLAFQQQRHAQCAGDGHRLSEFGIEQVKVWRRAYAVPPPPLALDDPDHPRFDPRYAHLPADVLPASECLADVVVRMLPYWYDGIVPDLVAGHTTLVTAHGNSLRALVKHLDGISDDEITEFPVCSNDYVGRPYRYSYNVLYKKGDWLFSGLKRYDMQTGKMARYEYGEGRYGSEPQVARAERQG